MSDDPDQRAEDRRADRLARARAEARARSVRRFFAIAGRYGLTDDERHELASQFLGRDVSSFRQLTVEEIDRLIDGLRCAAFLFVLLNQRRR